MSKSSDSDATRLAKQLVAGTFAGMAQVMVGHPLDTIKIRLQNDNRFNGALDCLKQTVKNEGVRLFEVQLSFFAPMLHVRGLFKGMASPILGAGIINAILFAAYGQAKQFIAVNSSSVIKPVDGSQPVLSIPQIALAGGIAGLINCVVAGPIELVKTQLQVQYTQEGAAFKGPLDLTKRIIVERGYAGLFRGMASTIYREVPAYAAFYGTFEASKRALTPKGAKPSDLAIHWVMFSGSVAGIGYWTACYPLDLIKTKIQSEPLVGPNSSARAPSIISVGAKIVKSHGVRALWKGFATCITRTIPAGAATFTAYEITAKILGL